jgi:hypothetical protein
MLSRSPSSAWLNCCHQSASSSLTSPTSARRAHEVETGAKARLLHQAEGRAAAALFKARLHHPDLAHVGAQLAAARDVAHAGVEHLVDGLLQRRQRVFLARQARVPARQHVLPQHAGQQKGRRHRLALGHAAVGVLQRRLDEGLLGALDHHVQQRDRCRAPGPAS